MFFSFFFFFDHLKTFVNIPIIPQHTIHLGSIFTKRVPILLRDFLLYFRLSYKLYSRLCVVQRFFGHHHHYFIINVIMMYKCTRILFNGVAIPNRRDLFRTVCT
jgi:hypothetical protein